MIIINMTASQQEKDKNDMTILADNVNRRNEMATLLTSSNKERDEMAALLAAYKQAANASGTLSATIIPLSPADAIKMDNMELVEELSLPPVKIHCSVLAQDAVQSAVNDYRKKNGMEEF